MSVRRRANQLLHLALACLALALAGASSAAWSTTSAHPGNALHAASLTQENSLAGRAVLSAEGMVPGQSRSGQLTLTNTGDVSARLTLTQQIAEQPTASGHALSEALQLTVRNSEGATVYTGSLAGLSSQVLETFSAGEQRTYRFEVLLPADTGNELQGAQASSTLTWTQTAL